MNVRRLHLAFLPRHMMYGVCAIAIATLVASQSATAVHIPPAALHWWLLDYGTSPPPPLSPPIIQQFWHLYAAYQSSKANASMPFSQWLIANGVTDPHSFAAMMWLYQWYARNHEVV